jgi:hypothetical protein
VSEVNIYTNITSVTDIGAHDGKPIGLGDVRESISYAEAHCSRCKPALSLGSLATGWPSVSQIDAKGSSSKL